MKMLMNSKSLVDNTTIQFEKSLKELKDFSSQLYHAADYYETTFISAKDKTPQVFINVVDNTKEYICRAVVTIVDHLGSISANLECCISKTNSVPQTEHKLDTLKKRIAMCEQYSYKLAIPRFYRTVEFSRYHPRYIFPPSAGSSLMNSTVSRALQNSNGVKSDKTHRFETEEPLFLYTYHCKPSLTLNSTRDTKKKDNFSPPVLPVRDGSSILPKAENSCFQFQEAQKLRRNTVKWKLMYNKEITSLIRRGKRIIT